MHSSKVFTFILGVRIEQACITDHLDGNPFLAILFSLSAHHLKTRISHNVFDLVLTCAETSETLGDREGWRVIDVVNAVPASSALRPPHSGPPHPVPPRPSSEIRLHEIQSQPFVRCACPRFKMSRPRPPSDVQTCNRTWGVTGFHIILSSDNILSYDTGSL